MSSTTYPIQPSIMFNRVTDIGGTIGVVSLNIYTIAEYIKSSTPILLAIGSLSLTIVMIIVQFKKKQLLTRQVEMTNQQLEQQKLECAKTLLEIEELKRRKEDDLSND